MDARLNTSIATVTAFCLAAVFALCMAISPETSWAISDESPIGAISSKSILAIDANKPEGTTSKAGESPQAQTASLESAYGEDAVDSTLEAPPEMTADIMGEGVIPADAMVALYQQSGYPYPSDVYADAGAPTIEDFVDLCIEEASAEGVRPEVLFSQIVHETGWLQFGGQVSPEQCNFGGLGATNDGAAGATFPDVRTGLRAQVQHLKAYASTDDLENEAVDPRFDLVSRGCAPTVYDLGGRWAVPGDTYGDALMQRMEDMYAIAYG